MLNPLTASLRH